MKSEKISKKLLFAWPTKTAAITILSMVVGYISFFATDYLGLDVSTVGILFMASQMFDGITDVFVGYLIDRTNTKLGKGRPYELALIGYVVCLILLFGAPQMGIAETYIYVFVMYTLINAVFLTFLNCNDVVYMANVIDRPEDSVTLSAVCGFVSMATAIIAGVAIPQLVKSFGTSRHGWFVFSAVVSIPCALLGMIRFVLIKEKHQAGAAQKKVSFKEMFKTIISNKYILLFSLIILVNSTGSTFQQNSETYYAQYIFGDVGTRSILSLAAFGMMLAMAIVPALTKRFGFVKTMKITTILGLIGYIARLINPSNLAYVVACNIFSGLGFTVLVSFGNTFIIDCMDYGEWKTGVRSEGILACAKNFTAKIGTGIGAGMIGILLGFAGYDGTLAVQPTSANNMIIFLGAVMPAICCLIQLVILHFYDLDDKIDDIRIELTAKKS